MAAVRHSAPGMSAAPDKRQLPPRVKSRFAKNPTSQAGKQYRVAKRAQLTTSPAITEQAAIARMGGAQAPHHGSNSTRLKATRQPDGYRHCRNPNREKNRTSL